MICNSLDEVRENIDRIDNNIIKLIAERGGYVAQAAKFKKNEDGDRDTSRVEKVIQKVREKAQLYGADPVEYCKTKIHSPDCRIYKDGKNWYCETDGIKITVNSFCYTIITAHKTQQK